MNPDHSLADRPLHRDPHARRLLRGRWPAIVRIALWAGLLAACTAAYGALAGPALRALFGGGGLNWPNWLAPHLPPPPDLETLRTWLPLVIVAIALLKALAFHRHAVGLAELGQDVVAELRRALHRQTLRLPPDLVRALGLGDLVSRATHDAEAAERLLTDGVATTLRDGLQALALIAVCVALDPWLALVSFAVYPLAFWPVARFARRLRRAAGDAHAEKGALGIELTDQIGRAALIQLSGAVPWAEARFGRVVDAVRAAVVRSVRIRAFASPFTEVLGAAALAGTLIYAAQRVSAGQTAPENVIGFFAALMLLYQPIKGLVRAQEVIQPGRAALARIADVLERTERLPAGGRIAPPARAPTIELSGVRIERGGRVVLDRLDLRLEPGRITALIGPNGSGKTTTAWIVAGLMAPAAGEIRIDGRPLAELDAERWRGRIGWVTQGLDLGRGTVRENVLFGDPPGGAERLAAVARATGLDRVVARLPDRWQTPLGDGGAGLSGGERQRVALARALVRAPTVLVLDEPDAHLDAEAIAGLRAALPGVTEGRTVLLITHDPAVAELADHVVRLGEAP